MKFNELVETNELLRTQLSKAEAKVERMTVLQNSMGLTQETLEAKRCELDNLVGEIHKAKAGLVSMQWAHTNEKTAWALLEPQLKQLCPEFHRTAYELWYATAQEVLAEYIKLEAGVRRGQYIRDVLLELIQIEKQIVDSRAGWE